MRIVQLYSIPFLLLSLVGTAQDVLWEKSYGGNLSDYLYDVQPTADNGFLLAGSSLSDKSGNKSSDGNGDLDYWIWKMDSNGELDWQKSFGGNGSDLLKSLKTTADGGFILGGTSDSNAMDLDRLTEGAKTTKHFGGNDYWVIKLNAKGGEEWQKSFGGIGQDDLAVITSTKDGGYIVGGSSSSDAAITANGAATTDKAQKLQRSKGNMDYWIIKLDKDGNVEWQKTYGGKYADLLRNVIPTTDGGYLVGGSSNSPQSGDKDNVNYGEGNDFWIIKLDKKGDIQWQQTIGGELDDQLYAMIQTYDKGFILGGSSTSEPGNTKSKTNGEGTDLWLLKYDAEGQQLWQETYNFGKVDILTSIVENDDHSLMVGGYAQPQSSKADEGINDFIALKISETGDRLWERTVGSEGEDILKKAILLRDGSYLLAGTSNPDKLPPRSAKDKAGKKGSATIGNGGNIAALDKAQKAVDGVVKDVSDKVNNTVTDKIDKATNKLNDKLNPNKDSRFKVGVNGPAGNLMNMTKGGGNALDGIGNMVSGGKNTNKPASRDKKMNFGRNDFWVVKLGEKGKKTKEGEGGIEAYPNPTRQFVNVIVDHEFERGRVTVHNLAGAELFAYDINERTVPVDLGGYPEGIYIITVVTNKGKWTVKVIKN